MTTGTHARRESPKNQQTPTSKPPAAPRNGRIAQASLLTVDADRHFAEFWAAYPRRVGKKPARKAFVAALGAGADPAVLIAAAAGYRALVDVERRDARYVLHPATWLNQERWDDELPAAKPRREVDCWNDAGRIAEPGVPQHVADLIARETAAAFVREGLQSSSPGSERRAAPQHPGVVSDGSRGRLRVLDGGPDDGLPDGDWFVDLTGSVPIDGEPPQSSSPGRGAPGGSGLPSARRDAAHGDLLAATARS